MSETVGLAESPFFKAQDLIRSARLAATRRRGISLEEICREFGVSHRTAQRMTEALMATFPLADHIDDEDRKRRWTLADPDLDKLMVSENL